MQKKVTTTDDNGLPAVKQEGKNTLGFLLNGQPWTPKDFDGTSNLSIEVDIGFNQGFFGISAYRITNDREAFGIGCDSLNFLTPPVTLQIHKNSSTKIGFSKNPCTIDYFDTTVYRSVNLTINKYDKTNRIIAGTFNATLYKLGCDTFKITEGRFDMKF